MIKYFVLCLLPVLFVVSQATAAPRRTTVGTQRMTILKRKPSSTNAGGVYIYGCSYSGLTERGPDQLFNFPLATAGKALQNGDTFSDRKFKLQIAIDRAGVVSFVHTGTFEKGNPISFSQQIDGFDTAKGLFPGFTVTLPSPFKDKTYSAFTLDCR